MRSALRAAAVAALIPAAAVAAPVHYALVPAQSVLEFTGTQAGAPFRARFHEFTATIDFAADDIAHSHFDVVIGLASVDSKDRDRDGTMRGADLFDVAKWPTARYVTSGFTKTTSGYEASGTLTLRGVTREVPIAFRFTPTAGGATLTGSAKVERLDFGVGQGDWKSTEWVGNDVEIDFSIVLTPKR